MKLAPRTAAFCAIALTMVLGIGLYWYVKFQTRPSIYPDPGKLTTQPHENDDPSGKTVAPTQPVGQIRLSDDADAKQNDFWLEQAFRVIDVDKGAGQEWLQLYAGIDAESLNGLRAVVSSTEVRLEAVENKTPRLLSKASLPIIAAGDHTLGLLWRKGELGVWLDDQELYSTKPAGDDVAMLKKPSGGVGLIDNCPLGARRAIALGNIRFTDTFMRTAVGGDWRPAAGKWELTALAFPERSANPFSLRAFFGTEKPDDDKLYAGRLRTNNYGLGLEISPFEGTLNIIRITGGSPAQRAGLAEDDIFLAIDGMNVDEMDPRQAYQMLTQSGFRNQVKLKMLRPGEKQPREYNITRDQFRWGSPAQGLPIEPQSLPLIGEDRKSMIIAGEAGWSDYTAEVAVKPLGSGGAGLAIGVLSPKDYVVFRWRGPAPRVQKKTPVAEDEEQPQEPEERAQRTPSATDSIELVRVKGGVETILAQAKAAYRPYEFYRLSVDWNGADVKCFIDGNEMLHASIPDLKHGGIGLQAMRGDPVFFDDVRVTSDHATVAGGRQAERSLNNIFAREDDMEVWANPALEWEHDLKTGWATNKGRFPGLPTVTVRKPKFDKLEIGIFNSLGLLTIENGQARLSFGDQKPVPIKMPIESIVLTRNGAKIDGVELKCSPYCGNEENPVETQKVNIRGLKNLGDPATVRVTSTGTLEYTFDAAPVDWKVENGRWGLLNKWICDPRWSWFGGRTKTVGTLWNKNVFRGDITVDAHVALMMQKDDPPYERPGDYNIALCGDGVNLDSGYTLIFGGDNNTWTRLYRKGVLVAESTAEDHRVFSDRIRHPDKPQLHQRWFHLKLEKIGDQISFYRDDMLAFTFKDKEPIAEGRVGFWTLDNGFLLSRVRIAHGGARPAPFESRRSLVYEDSRVVNAYDGEPYSTVEPQKLPREINDSLQGAPATFREATAEPLSASDVVFKGALNAPPPAWHVTNGTSGGPFLLQWRAQTIDPEVRSIVRFAYCIEPGSKIDLYLVDTTNRETNSPNFNPRNNGAYRWRLTGPETSDEFAPLVGSIPNVKADGKWHTVQYDLQPAWRAFWKSRGFNRGPNSNMRVMVGNLSNQGYLLAGMNGNHAGAVYGISDLQVMVPREIDPVPAKIARVIWPFDPDGDGRSVTLCFDDQGGCGVNTDSLDLHINNNAVPRELMDFDAPKQRLSVDLTRLKLGTLKDAQQIDLKLLGFEDRAQNASPAFTAQWTFAPEKAFSAKRAVAAPVVSMRIAGVPDVSMGNQPLYLTDVTTFGGHQCSRVQDSDDAPPWAPASMRNSVQVVCPSDGAQFGFSLNTAQLDLKRYQHMQIDYKVPIDSPFNLHLYDAWGTTHALLMTDLEDARDMFSENVRSRFGPPADFVADGTWRSTTVPMLKMFSATNPQMPTEITGMSLHDNGWRGTRRGLTFWIHRLQPIPTVKPNEISFTWSAAELTGLADYAACIDQQPTTDPMNKQEIKPGETLDESLRRRNVGMKDGWTYFHLRVKNGAGQWSEAVHRKFFLDSTGPQIVKSEPADGGETSGQTLKMFMKEDSGLNVRSLSMTINGRVVSGFGNGFSFDSNENCIIYNAAAAGAPWPDASELKIEVRMLSDQIGNSIETPYAFAFRTRHAADTEGPAIKRIHWSSTTEQNPQHRQMEMETSFGLNFEQQFGHVHAMRDCKFDWIDDPAQAAFGRRAVKFSAVQDDADVQIMLHKNSFYMDRFPLLHFDYKADPGFKADLLIEVLGEWLSIQFTGDGAAPTDGRAIGKIADVSADGTWHHASVDLRALVDAVKKDLPVRIINKIILSAQGHDGCLRGSTLTLDNVDLSPASGQGGVAEWEAADDPSGIAGYAYVFDQNAATVPAAAIGQTTAGNYAGGVEGTWYAHVRACDNAGNWGPTRHLKLNFGR